MSALSAINSPTVMPTASIDKSLYRRRRLWNKVGLGFASFAMVFGLFWYKVK